MTGDMHTPDGAPDSSGAAPAPTGESRMEERLRSALIAQAHRAPVGAADWGDLAGRLAHTSHRRTRLLAAAVASALLVGAAGGYLGDAASSSPAPVAAARGAGRSATFEAPSSGNAPAASAPGSSAPCPASAGTARPSGIGSSTHVFSRITADGVTIRVYRPAALVAPCVAAPAPAVGSATTTTTGPQGAAGKTSSKASPSSGAVVPGTQTAVVLGTQNVVIELSDDSAVGQGVLGATCVGGPPVAAPGQSGVAPPPVSTAPSVRNAPAVTEPALHPIVPAPPRSIAPTTTIAPSSTTTTVPPATTVPPSTTVPPTTTVPGGAPTSPQEPRTIATGAFGVAEGDPVWWVAVDVGTDVSSVTMTFAGGASDQMVPVGGVAVLAGHIGATTAASGQGPAVVRGTLELAGTDGSVLATMALPLATGGVPPSGPLPFPVTSPPATGTTSSAPGSGSASSPGAGTGVAGTGQAACPMESSGP